MPHGFPAVQVLGFIGLQAPEHNVGGIYVIDAVHKFLLGAVTSLATSGELMSFHVGFCDRDSENLRIFRNPLNALFSSRCFGPFDAKKARKISFFLSESTFCRYAAAIPYQGN